MSPERQVTVIAETQGWEEVREDAGGAIFIGTLVTNLPEGRVLIQRDHCVPDYLNSYDAILPAVRLIIGASGYASDTFARKLAEVCGDESNDSESDSEFLSFDFVLAPPAKWCEAILKWSDKWEESE